MIGTTIDDKYCDYPCAGNATEMCGSLFITSLYQDPSLPAWSTASLTSSLPTSDTADPTSSLPTSDTASPTSTGPAFSPTD